MISNASSAASAGLVVSAVATVHGLQLLRSGLSSLSVYLGQVRDLDATLLAIVIFMIFLSGFAAPLAQRTLGTQRGLLVLAAALALLRLAEQVSGTPDARLVAEVAGLIVWLWLLPLIVMTRFGSSEDSGGAWPFIGILLGLTVDTAIKGVFGTLDPSSSTGVTALLATVALTVAQLAVVISLWRTPGDRAQVGGLPASAFCIGPALALQVLLFQNLARHTVLIGWNLPAISVWVLIANVLAIWFAMRVARSDSTTPRWLSLVVAAVLMMSAAPPPSPVAAAVVALTGPLAIAVLLATALAPGSTKSGAWFASALGLLAIPLVLFGWYAHYEIGFPIPQWLIAILAATLVAFPACLRRAKNSRDARADTAALPIGSSTRARPTEAATLAIGLLFLCLPLYQFLTWSSPGPVPDNGSPLRVMTYNIHQGFDLHGRPSLERIANVVEAQQPDVVALQEVPRGWVVNGSVDALSWLSQRLGMRAAWGPAADDFWGNAVLSRYPIEHIEHLPMPNNSEIRFNRAYLVVTLAVHGQLVQVVATHLHHIEREPQHRLPQVRALLNRVDWSRPTVLLGDLNAQPHHREIQLLVGSGLLRTGPATPTYPADQPRRQIDYVFATNHFSFKDVEATPTTASDHLPLTAVLSGPEVLR